LAKAKNAISLGISALIVIALIIVVGFGLFINDTFDSTSTATTSTTSYLNSTSSPSTQTSQTGTATMSSLLTEQTSSSASSSSGLSLDLSVTSFNGSVTINVEEYNTLGNTYNITAANNWPSTQSSLFFPPCPDVWPPVLPVNFALFEGYYAQSNFTSAKALVIQPDIGYSCTIAIGQPGVPRVSYISFFPNSDRADIVPPGNDNSLIAISLSSNEYYTGGNGTTLTTSRSLSQGTYTAIATDEWGKVVIIHFTLTTAVFSGSTSTSNQSASSPQQYSYTSDINSSNPCNYTNQTASSIISNIEHYPEFISLEGNRTYTLDGYGCSMSNPTGTNATYQSTVTFRYYDLMHLIYYQCDNHTVSTPPYYQIIVTLDLTPTGYDLGSSSFKSILVPPFEGCPNFNYNGTS